MELKPYSEAVKEVWKEGAILNTTFPGFKEDYLCLHCLIRKHRPKTFFEIGTSVGIGTKIIKNALENGELYSLDLPDEQITWGGKVGCKCNLPYTQLRGDSMTFDFSQYPCEGYFVDGCHSHEHVYHETTELLKLNPKLIIFHDTDTPVVLGAITQSFNDQKAGERYSFFRVVDTRISYLLKHK